MSRTNTKIALLKKSLLGDGIHIPVKTHYILKYNPKLTNVEIRSLAKNGLLTNAEIYSGPLPVSVAIKLEAMGITSIAKISDAIRAGKLDLSKFNSIGPKRWSAILKWAQINVSMEKRIHIRLGLPAHIILNLSDMARAPDSAIQNPAIAYVVKAILDACRTLPTLPKGRLRGLDCD